MRKNTIKIKLIIKFDTFKKQLVNKGLNPAQAGKKIGISSVTMYRVCNGNPTSPQTAKKIADALELSVDDLFDY